MSTCTYVHVISSVTNPLELEGLCLVKQHLHIYMCTLSTDFHLSNTFSEIALSTPSAVLSLSLTDSICVCFVSKLTDGRIQRFVHLADKLGGTRKSLDSTFSFTAFAFVLLCLALLFTCRTCRHRSRRTGSWRGSWLQNRKMLKIQRVG